MPPALLIGDKVVVSTKYKGEWKTFTTIVRKAMMNVCFWEYNYGTPEAFFYRDVIWVEKKGKWKSKPYVTSS